MDSLVLIKLIANPIAGGNARYGLAELVTSLKLQTIPKIIVPCILVSIVFNKYVNELVL